MNSIDLLYTCFGIVLLLIVVVYYLSARHENEELSFLDSKIFIVGSIGYFFVFFSNFFHVLSKEIEMYIFFLSTLYLSTYFLHCKILDKDLVPKKLYLVLNLFETLWMVFSIIQGHSVLATALPILLAQAVCFYFVGLGFITSTNIIQSTRNILGVLFVMLSSVKLIYMINAKDYKLYFPYLFTADVTIYIAIGLILVSVDMKRQYEVNPSDWEEKFQLMNKIPIGILTLNECGDIVSMNNRVKTVFQQVEQTIEEYETINIKDYIQGNFFEQWKEVVQMIRSGGIYRTILDVKLDPQETSYEFSFMSMEDQEDILCLIHSTSDHIINDQKRVYLRKQKSEENILNRYQLMEAVEVGVSTKMLSDFCLIMIKIKNYAPITSVIHSHEAENIDKLLIHRLEKLHFVYGVGKIYPDTFEVISLNVENKKEIEGFISELAEVLTHLKFYDQEMNCYSIDYCMGIAISPIDGVNHRELHRKAQIAVTEAQLEEKRNFQFYSEQIRFELAKKMQLENSLREAIVDEKLFLEFQPQYHTQSGKIRGFEALVRWRTKDGLVISPSEFVHIAEEAGFMNDLGEWVLQNGMKEAVVWNVEHGMNWILSVNISVSQIRNEGFSDYILKLLSDNNYEAQLLEIEVTETKMATSDDRVFIELKKLRENGIRIAIDDFGMGYSSFDYLRWMPFHVLKIDKSFVDRLVDQEIEAAIVDSIIKLVERLDLEIIAEGVETEEQLEILRKTSCNYIQGYVYSRPISQEKVLQLIQEERVVQ